MKGLKKVSNQFADHLLGSIETLKETALICSQNQKFHFGTRFSEMMNEMMAVGIDPTTDRLFTTVHEENISIIENFYIQYNYSRDEIFTAVDYYWKEIAPGVEVDIENALFNSYGRMFGQNIKETEEDLIKKFHDRFGSDQEFVLPLSVWRRIN